MAGKSLKQMSRQELLEMLVAQGKEAETLQSELEKARAELSDRRLKIAKAGSLAEAALSLNGVFEAAEAAARQYLENVRANAEGKTELKPEMSQKTESTDTDKAAALEESAKQAAEKTVADAEKKAEDITLDARQRAQGYTADAKREAEQTVTLAKQEAEQTAEAAARKAEKLLADAEKKAGQLLSDAEKRAGQITSEAGKKAEKITSEAEERAGRLIAEAEEKAGELVSQAEENKKRLTAQADAYVRAVAEKIHALYLEHPELRDAFGK